jgi:hypothetical protein
MPVPRSRRSSDLPYNASSRLRIHVGGWRQRVGLPLSNAATVILCVATFAWSCGGGKSNSPTSPTTDVHIAGTWTGTFTSSVIGLSQPASATLSQSGSSVNGTITCSGGPCLFSSASISGNVTGTTVTAQANYLGGAFYSAGSCTYNGTVSSSATRMDGTYSCTNGDRGSWSLTKSTGNPNPAPAPVTCSPTVSPTSFSFGSAGGARTVSIEIQTGCRWEIGIGPYDPEASWITITSGSGLRTGNGQVVFAVAANSSTNARKGRLGVEYTGGQRQIAVTQSGRNP